MTFYPQHISMNLYSLKYIVSMRLLFSSTLANKNYSLICSPFISPAESVMCFSQFAKCVRQLSLWKCEFFTFNAWIKSCESSALALRFFRSSHFRKYPVVASVCVRACVWVETSASIPIRRTILQYKMNAIKCCLRMKCCRNVIGIHFRWKMFEGENSSSLVQMKGLWLNARLRIYRFAYSHLFCTDFFRSFCFIRIRCTSFWFTEKIASEKILKEQWTCCKLTCVHVYWRNIPREPERKYWQNPLSVALILLSHNISQRHCIAVATRRVQTTSHITDDDDLRAVIFVISSFIFTQATKIGSKPNTI